MITALVLWFLGLLLIFLEFYLPGAIMGIAGGIVIFVSLVLFVQNSGSVLLDILYLMGVIFSLVWLIRYALWRIPHTKSEYSIYSDKDQAGYVASGYDQSAIGKQGVVLSDLKPGGYILIDGKQHQALSQTGYIVKGTQVKVIAGEGESLIVKNLSETKV